MTLSMPPMGPVARGYGGRELSPPGVGQTSWEQGRSRGRGACPRGGRSRSPREVQALESRAPALAVRFRSQVAGTLQEAGATWGSGSWGVARPMLAHTEMLGRVGGR